MTVDLNLVTALRPHATLIPSATLDADGVWIVDAGRARRRLLRLGARGPEAVEVVEGLRPGTVVIVDPPAGLREGRRVRERPR